jgi:hypothetical protein
VGLPRPRPRTLITHPDFVALKQRCLHLLSEDRSGEAQEAA